VNREVCLVVDDFVGNGVSRDEPWSAITLFKPNTGSPI
jgi:hypothetical protein